MTTTSELVPDLVDGYLTFLGYADRPAPTVASLVELHQRHLARVPYENLEIMLGRPPSVAPLDSLARVGRVGRAGYCFHQNGALEVALRELGFAVERRHGHVWTSEDDRHTGVLNHLVLVVTGLPTDDNPGGEWWPDVGLGDALGDPLPLVVGEYEQGGFDYALTEVRDDGWSFLADRTGSFTGVEVSGVPTDAEIAERHASLSTPPDGRFATVLVVQRRMPEHVDVVRGCLSHRITPGGQTEVELTSYDAWRSAIEDGCGLSLAEVDDAELRALFDRQLAAHRTYMETPMSDDLLDIADELYGLPLADFTPARDAKAKELKGTDLAAPVKALKKPTMAAWVVNMLVRHETEQVDQVLAVGAALRDAAQSLDGKELRELTKQRRQLTAAVTTRARGVAGSLGTKVTQAVADQVESTLTAAMLDPDCARGLRSGLLVTHLTSTGLGESAAGAAVALPEALGFAASSAPAPAEQPVGRPDLKVVPDPDAEAKKLAAAQAAMEAAEAVEESARATYDEAERAVTELEARSLQVQGEIEERRRQIAELEETAEEVEEELDEAEDARTEARTSLRKAEQAREQAETALDRLRKKR